MILEYKRRKERQDDQSLAIVKSLQFLTQQQHVEPSVLGVNQYVGLDKDREGNKKQKE